MIIQKESVYDVIEDVIPLLVSHWEEAEKGVTHSNPQPDINNYLELDAQGVYIFITARVDDKIVGYIGDIIHKSLHYDDLHAVNDVMYVNKEYRGSSCFHKMLRLAESIEKNMGATDRFMNLKSKGKSRGGYAEVERVVHKYLGD